MQNLLHTLPGSDYSPVERRSCFSVPLPTPLQTSDSYRYFWILSDIAPPTLFWLSTALDPVDIFPDSEKDLPLPSSISNFEILAKIHPSNDSPVFGGHQQVGGIFPCSALVPKLLGANLLAAFPSSMPILTLPSFATWQ